MNEREKKFLDLMMETGLALLSEARKCNIDPRANHSIVIEPEEGYVNAYIIINGVNYCATRFEQFPEIRYEAIDTRSRSWMKKDS